MTKTIFLALAAAFGLMGVVEAQTTVDIAPSKDNTLYQHASGSLSNGAGQHLFAGNTASGLARRAVLHFDVADHIPAGATIHSVAFTLNMSRTISGAQTVALHRVLADWGEGTSTASFEEGGGAPAAANDATWLHRFYDTQLWDNPGGDFAGGASGSLGVGETGFYTWTSTPEMVADVQHWLDTPEENFGWILIGNEAANTTAKRFDSRHHVTEANRPVLSVTYTADLPVELVDFRSESSGSTVTLRWATASEANNHGFEIQRQAIRGPEWFLVGFVPGAGNSNTVRSYSYHDDLKGLVEVPRILHYRLRQIDFDGTATYSEVLAVDTGVPNALSLGPSYPNPARTASHIPYSVPVAQQVRITLYDMLGRVVQVLVDGQHESGRYRASLSVENLPPGLYHFELQAGQTQERRQMVVLP